MIFSLVLIQYIQQSPSRSKRSSLPSDETDCVLRESQSASCCVSSWMYNSQGQHLAMQHMHKLKYTLNPNILCFITTRIVMGSCTILYGI